MITNNRIRVLPGAAAICLLAASAAVAQNEQVWNNTGVSNWNTGTNWGPFASPPNADFEEIGVINNGGTAFLSTAATSAAGGVVIGRGADVLGGNGTLEIRSGGSLTLQPSGSGVVGGRAFVGSGKTGTLSVQPGGTLTAEFLQVYDSASVGQSSLNLGGTMAGATTLTVDNTELGGTTRVTGPNVNFTTGNLIIDSTNTLIAGITGASHSTIQATGIASLSGALNLQFTGYTPTLGNSWTLLHAGGVTGSFTPNVTSNATLPAGQNFVLSNSVLGNGTTNVNVSVESVLTLNVNRATGQLMIKNVNASPISLDGYAVLSPTGALSPTSGNWTSLHDQAVGSWEESTATNQILSELAPSGSTSVSSNQLSLGNAYQPPLPAFGTQIPENVVFSYRRASDGKSMTGLVQYEGNGVANTLVLTVDPATGNARMKNDSQTALDLDGYSVSSLSNSLKLMWNSLHDQATVGWDEASPTTARLSELNAASTMSMATNGTFDLNGLFNTSGSQDLQLQFHSKTLGTFLGVVRYGSLSGGLQGDYNGNGVVDAADYVIWRNNDGSPGGYTTWRANFGHTSGAGSGASLATATVVPEPYGLALLIASIICCVTAIRNRGKQQLSEGTA